MIRPVCFIWCSTPSHPWWPRMQQSLRAWGWKREVHVAPWVEETTYINEFTGRFDRWRSEGYTHALNLCAFDMLCTGSPDELPAALEHYGSPSILMSAEAGCWPGDYRRTDYGEVKHPWWFAHSPMTVDLAQRPEDILARMPDRGYGTIQMYFADLILDREPGVAIDRDTKVILSVAHCHPWSDWFSVEGDRVRNKITGSTPCVAHGNGRTPIDWCPTKRPA